MFLTIKHKYISTTPPIVYKHCSSIFFSFTLLLYLILILHKLLKSSFTLLRPVFTSDTTKVWEITLHKYKCDQENTSALWILFWSCSLV